MNAQSPVWLFDLDNTLHNASAHVFPHINRAMTAYLAEHLALSMEDANSLRTRYWQRYGATMLGLMRHHGTKPRHFLHHTHQFPDLPALVIRQQGLAACLRRLPGRKVVFSNAPRAYAREVVRLLGLTRHFEAVFGIEDLGFHPKPQPLAYKTVLRRLRVPASRCIMVEDTLANLRSAHRLGMRTVWIGTGLRGAPWVGRRLRSVRQLRA